MGDVEAGLLEAKLSGPFEGRNGIDVIAEASIHQTQVEVHVWRSRGEFSGLHKRVQRPSRAVLLEEEGTTVVQHEALPMVGLNLCRRGG